MRKITRLKKEARERAENLGHNLGRFETIRYIEESPGYPPLPKKTIASYTATCYHCGAQVIINPARFSIYEETLEYLCDETISFTEAEIQELREKADSYVESLTERW